MMYTLAFVLGPWEIAVVVLIVVLLFGKRLPRIMKEAAKGIKGFQSEIRSTKHDIKHAGDPAPQRRQLAHASQSAGDSASVTDSVSA